MVKITFYDSVEDYPDSLTYPEIHPVLMARAIRSTPEAGIVKFKKLKK